MPKYIIKYKTKQTKDLLCQHGTITYESGIIDVVFLETSESVETLQKIEGVISVNLSRKGKLPFIPTKTLK